LKQYLQTLASANYCLKTQLNHLLAIQRLYFWIEFRVSTKQWDNLHKRRNVKQLLAERHKWVAAQIKVSKPAAETETIARNDRTVLEQNNKWASFEELMQVHSFLLLLLLLLLLLSR
jgi:predicted component of type VI protein secretion system